MPDMNTKCSVLGKKSQKIVMGGIGNVALFPQTSTNSGKFLSFCRISLVPSETDLDEFTRARIPKSN